MQRLILVLAALATLVLAGACAGAAASDAPTVTAGPQMTISVNNSMQFTPSSFAVQAGQPVELTLDNVGDGMAHDFTLTEGVAQPVKIEASGGQQAKATFTIDKPGTYTFTCSQPMHGLAGMKGTIVAR
jgi:plastocyanin